MAEAIELNAANALGELGKSPKFLKGAERAVKPFYGTAAVVAGTVLAPFTGGASLAVGAAVAGGISAHQQESAAKKAAKQESMLALQEDAWTDFTAPSAPAPTETIAEEPAVPTWAWLAVGGGGAILLLAALR